MPNIWKVDKDGEPYIVTQQKRGRKSGSGAIPPAIASLTDILPESTRPIEIIPREGASLNELITTSLQNLLNGFALDELSTRIIKRHGYDPNIVASNKDFRSKIVLRYSTNYAQKKLKNIFSLVNRLERQQVEQVH